MCSVRRFGSRRHWDSCVCGLSAGFYGFLLPPTLLGIWRMTHLLLRDMPRSELDVVIAHARLNHSQAWVSRLGVHWMLRYRASRARCVLPLEAKVRLWRGPTPIPPESGGLPSVPNLPPARRLRPIALRALRWWKGSGLLHSVSEAFTPHAHSHTHTRA